MKNHHILECVFQVDCSEHSWGQDSAGARSCVTRYVLVALIVLNLAPDITVLCLHFGSLQFKSYAANWLYCLKVFLVFFSPSKQMLESYLKMNHDY